MEEIAPKIVAGERRLTMLLMGHWQELRGGRRAPLARAFKTAVPPDLLTDCFTLLPAETPDRSRLHDIGERIARVSGIAVTSLTLSEVPHDTLIGTAAKWLDRALETGVPVVDEGEFEDRHGARARRTPSKRGHPSEAIQARPAKREGTGAAKEFAPKLGVSFSPPIVGKTHPGPACWSRPRPLPGPEPKSVFRVRSAPKARRAPRCFGSVQIIVIMPGTDRAGPSGRKESTGSIAPAVDGG